MTLDYRQERQLRRADHALRRSDPDLASKLSIFARLAAAEAMPVREQLPRRPWNWRVLLWPVAAVVFAAVFLIVFAAGGGSTAAAECGAACGRRACCCPRGRAAPGVTARGPGVSAGP